MRRVAGCRCLLAAAARLAALVVAAASPRALGAQVILDVERLQSEDVAGAHLSLAARGKLTAGNTDVLELDLAAVPGYRAERHWIRFLGGLELLEDDGDKIVDNRYAHVRYNYWLAPRLRTFHFVQLQENRNLLLERRILAGSGLRYRLLRGARHRLDAGTGLMYESERLDAARLRPGEDAEADVVRLANIVASSWTLREGLELVNVTYLQPRVDEPGDLRLLDNLALGVALAGGVGLEVSARWRLDTRPPAGLEENDVSVELGLTWDVD